VLAWLRALGTTGEYYAQHTLSEMYLVGCCVERHPCSGPAHAGPTGGCAWRQRRATQRARALLAGVCRQSDWQSAQAVKMSLRLRAHWASMSPASMHSVSDLLPTLRDQQHGRSCDSNRVPHQACTLVQGGFVSPDPARSHALVCASVCSTPPPQDHSTKPGQSTSH
jgi:hypothetical protein